MNLKEYYKLLEKHDWHYNYSDDAYAYHKGAKERSQLTKIARESEKHLQLYNQFKKYVFSMFIQPLLKPKEPS